MPRSLARHATPESRQAEPLSPRMHRSKTPRARAIHDDLIERGLLYEQRREALQEKAAAREVRQCRGIPLVSQMARSLTRDGPIRDRLLRLADEKKKKEEFQQQRLDIAEAAVMKEWFKPKLSRKGGRTQGRTLHVKSGAWASKREDRVAERRRELVVEEMRDLQDAPSINPRSEMLAAVRREREGLAGYTHIEAMLERDRLARLAQWELERSAAAEAAAAATPRITQRAAAMDGDGCTVFERLARRAEEREERLAQLRQQRQAEVAAEAERRHSPAVSRVADFAERGRHFQEQREDNLQRLRAEERRRHTPTINPVSGAIAAQLPQSTFERLQRPLHDSPPRGPSRLHSPAARSTASTTAVDPTAAYVRFKAAEHTKQARLQEARDAEERRRLADCTFKPAVGDAATDDAAQEASSPALQRLYQRTTQWQRRRDDKLERAREEQEVQRRDAHSFAPSVSDPAPVAEPSALYGGDGRAWGFNEYVERIAEARRHRDAPPEHSAPTSAAAAPQLGVSRGPVAALAPPVRPPHHETPGPAVYDPAAAHLAEDLLR